MGVPGEKPRVTTFGPQSVPASETAPTRDKMSAEDSASPSGRADTIMTNLAHAFSQSSAPNVPEAPKVRELEFGDFPTTLGNLEKNGVTATNINWRSNQDAFGVSASGNSLVVCDGVGENEDSGSAARLVARVCAERDCDGLMTDDYKQWLEKNIGEAVRADPSFMLRYRKEWALKGAYTTLTAAHRTAPGEADIFILGDSPLYVVDEQNVIRKRFGDGTAGDNKVHGWVQIQEDGTVRVGGKAEWHKIKYEPKWKLVLASDYVSDGLLADPRRTIGDLLQMTPGQLVAHVRDEDRRWKEDDLTIGVLAYEHGPEQEMLYDAAQSDPVALMRDADVNATRAQAGTPLPNPILAVASQAPAAPSLDTTVAPAATSPEAAAVLGAAANAIQAAPAAPAAPATPDVAAEQRGALIASIREMEARVAALRADNERRRAALEAAAAAGGGGHGEPPGGGGHGEPPGHGGGEHGPIGHEGHTAGREDGHAGHDAHAHASPDAHAHAAGHGAHGHDSHGHGSHGHGEPMHLPRNLREWGWFGAALGLGTWYATKFFFKNVAHPIWHTLGYVLSGDAKNPWSSFFKNIGGEFKKAFKLKGGGGGGGHGGGHDHGHGGGHGGGGHH